MRHQNHAAGSARSAPVLPAAWPISASGTAVPGATEARRSIIASSWLHRCCFERAAEAAVPLASSEIQRICVRPPPAHVYACRQLRWSAAFKLGDRHLLFHPSGTALVAPPTTMWVRNSKSATRRIVVK